MENFDLKKYLAENKLLKEDNIDNESISWYENPSMKAKVYAMKFAKIFSNENDGEWDIYLDLIEDITSIPDAWPQGWDTDFIDKFADDIADFMNDYVNKEVMDMVNYNLGGGEERHGIEETIEFPEDEFGEYDDDFRKEKYTEEEWKYELELNALMAARLIAHQANGGNWDDLVVDLVDLQKKSKISTHLDYFKEWVMEQESNKLPNQSSGSFFTGLTDIDGLLSAMNFEEYDRETDIELYTDEEYQKASAYHNAMIRQEAPDWNKY